MTDYVTFEITFLPVTSLLIIITFAKMKGMIAHAFPDHRPSPFFMSG